MGASEIVGSQREEAGPERMVGQHASTKSFHLLKICWLHIFLKYTSSCIFLWTSKQIRLLRAYYAKIPVAHIVYRSIFFLGRQDSARISWLNWSHLEEINQSQPIIQAYITQGYFERVIFLHVTRQVWRKWRSLEKWRGIKQF